jgi:short-subunit dehydrogenase/acyl dehydratase
MNLEPRPIRYRVGDYVTLTRSFSREDLAAFARLSGDTNPLHGDDRYAAQSEFGRTIVPLHLTSAPLSAIAGTMIPGEPALYLGHELRAVSPVRFGETVTYSACVSAHNHSHGVISLKLLVHCAGRVVLDGTMRVRQRDQARTMPPAPTAHVSTDRCVAITGASGAVAGSIARALAPAGWNFLLISRSGEALEGLAADVRRHGAACEIMIADLGVPGGRQAAAAATRHAGAVAIVHTASPAVTASLAALVDVNYAALRALTEAAVPAMLTRQHGCVVQISSQAADTVPDGWEDYAMAKAMAATWTHALDRRLGQWGIVGLVVQPGFIDTGFSEGFRPEGQPVLLPDEVGAAVAEAMSGAQCTRGTLLLEPGSAKRVAPAGRPVSTTLADRADSHPAEPCPSAPSAASALAQTVGGFLGLGADQNLSGGGLGITPGWDSLRHIELLLHLEDRFGISFSTQDMVATTRFDELQELWRGKVVTQSGVRGH